MRNQLRRMFRNDPDALDLIDSYLLRFASYDEQEQEYLKNNEEALRIDFESFVNRVLEDQ